MPDHFTEWLRGLDLVLEQESALCGLYGHNLTAGNVREFLVRSLLRRFLPAIVSIETGMVIDYRGETSRQMDLILFDSRVPCLRSPDGTGLFPIEGVFATIEVKTRLDSTATAIGGLENSQSVCRLHATGDADFEKSIERRIEGIQRQEGISHRDAYILAWNCSFPATYIVAIENGISGETLCDAIDGWFHRPKDFAELTPSIPRMIVAGHCVAVANDRIAKFQVSGEAHSKAVEEFGPTGEVLVGIWPNVEHRWSWLATHLLLSLTYRMGITYDYLGGRYRIDRYLPFSRCFELEKQEEALVYHVTWKGEYPHYRENASTEG